MELCKECHNLICECPPELTNPELLGQTNSEEHKDTCELCNLYTPNPIVYNTMKMCTPCYEKELEAEKDLAEGADKRVVQLNTPKLFKTQDSDDFEKAINKMPMESVTDRPIDLPSLIK